MQTQLLAVLVLLSASTLGGCQHRMKPFGGVTHVKDPAQCAEIARGFAVHEGIERMRQDGTCDVWWTNF